MSNKQKVNLTLDQFINLTTSCFSSIKYAKQKNRSVLCWINSSSQMHNASILEIDSGTYILYDFREDKSYNAWTLIKEFHHPSNGKEIHKKLCSFANVHIQHDFKPFEKTYKAKTRQELFEYGKQLYSAVPARYYQSKYFKAKGLDHISHFAYGLKNLSDSSAIMPIYNANFEIQGYQYIKNHEHKRFYGTLKNGFVAITDDLNKLKTSDKLGLCEGVAKGLAIASTVDYPVVVGLSAFNIPNALKAMKSINPAVSFKLFGDHNSAGFKAYVDCKTIDENIEFTFIDDMNKDYDDLLVEDISALFEVVDQNRKVNDQYLDLLGIFNKKIKSIHKQYLDFNDYLSIKNVKTAFVKSSYGTGKNSNLIKHICENNDKVIFITHRITLANKSISQYYDLGFTSYLDYDSKTIDNNVDKLIIGIKSLHRFASDFDFSDYVVIVDELDQVLVDIDNYNHESLVRINRNKQKMLKTAKQFIGLSAGIGARDVKFITKFRDIEKSKLLVNHFVKGGVDCNIFEQKTEILHELEKDLILLNQNLSKEKIFIYSSSKQTTKDIAKIISKKFNKIKYQLINSDNSSNIHTREFIANITEKSNTCDVIIASPSANTGVDLNNKNYSKIYVIVDDKTMLIDDHLQALNRARKAKTAFIFIPNDADNAVAVPANKKSITEIKKEILSNHIKEIFKPENFESDDDMFNFLNNLNSTNFYEKYQHEIEYSHDVEKTRFREQQNYKTLFIQRLNDLGHNVVINSCDDHNSAGTKILEDISASNQLEKSKKIYAIKTINSSDNVVQISEKLDISIQESNEIINLKKSIETMLNLVPAVPVDDNSEVAEGVSVPVISESDKKDVINIFLESFIHDKRVKNLTSAVENKKQKITNYLYLTDRLGADRKYRKLALHSENFKFTDNFILQHWLVPAFKLVADNPNNSLEKNNLLINLIYNYKKEIFDLLGMDINSPKAVSKYLRSQLAGAGLSFVRRCKDLQHFLDVGSMDCMNELTQYFPKNNQVTKMPINLLNKTHKFVTYQEFIRTNNALTIKIEKTNDVKVAKIPNYLLNKKDKFVTFPNNN